MPGTGDHAMYNFESWGCWPNSNYLLSSFRKSGHDYMPNNATTYKKYEHTQFHSGMGTQTQMEIFRYSSLFTF